MKLITLLFASLATSLSACSDDAVNESQPETPNDEPTVSVDKNDLSDHKGICRFRLLDTCFCRQILDK